MKKAPLITADMAAAAPRRRKSPAPQRGQEPKADSRRVTILLAADDLKRLKLLAIETGQSQQALAERAILDMLKKSGA
jgi:hypothetical protein